MKIEKLTENKIRIILKQNDLQKKIIDLNSDDLQKLFIEILNKAKKEINFDVEGHKLFIETFSSDNDYVFTITKFIEENNNILLQCNEKNYLKTKKKTSINKKASIFVFNNFENFENFCYILYNKNNLCLENLFKKSLLYFYNDNYYLILKNIDILNNSINFFYSSISEFSKFHSYSENFESKLKEYGKLIIKNNTFNTFKKYFNT